MINKYNIKTMYSIQGKSLREIARETGHTFRTVKKHALTEDFSNKNIGLLSLTHLPGEAVTDMIDVHRV